MERAKAYSLPRGVCYSSLSGAIISLCIALCFFLAPYTEWAKFGAGMVASFFLVIGPFAGLVISAILAGLVYIPLYKASLRTAIPTILILPTLGVIFGLFAAFVCGMLLGNLIFPVYIIFAIWGALSGFLFVFGAQRHKFA